MKTKFFKKLSFVLALAMVLSVFAPAAGAFAAKKPKLNSTKKYLHLGVDGKDEFDFNISNKQKGWKYYWESANEDIAVVNEKNGLVTATGVGTTKVTVTITDANKEEVAELKATVVVRDNIKTVKISNAPEGNKLAVGQEFDFNRSFVTNSGSTKKTSAITRWTVDSDKATINDKGVFKADEAGKYTVTARSFQSKARYEAWLLDADTYKDYVLAEDTIEITVAASMVEAKQVDLSSVDVTFDSPMEDVEKNIKVYQMVGNTKVRQQIKGVTMDDTNKVATVSMYLDFAKGSNYVVEYPEMEAVTFKAATANWEDVVDIKIATTTAVKNEETDVKVKLFNADGVDITTDLLSTRVTLKGEAENGAHLDASRKKVWIYDIGKTIKVTATYHTYKYDTSTGEEVGALTDVATIVGVDAAAVNVTGVEAWTIVDNTSNPNWKDLKQLFAADDYNKKLFVKLNIVKGDKKETVSNNDYPNRFEFDINDKSVLMVDRVGNLYPVSQGTAVVIVKYSESGHDKVPVATVTITVGPKKQGAVLVAEVNDNIILSNTPGLNDQRSIKLTLKDQLGRGYQFNSYKVEKISAPIDNSGNMTAHTLTPVGTINNNPSNASGEIWVTFNADNKHPGSYVYRIIAEGVQTTINITVKEPNDTTPAYYDFEFTSTEQDMNVASWTTLPVEVGISLYGYASNGAKIVKLNNDPRYRIEVDAPTDNNNPDGQKFQDINDLDAANENGYKVVKTYASGVTGQVVRKAPIGTYVVTAYERATNRPIASRNFTTKDTQEVATFEVKSLTYKNSLTQAEINNSTQNGVASAGLILAVTGRDNNNGIKFYIDGDPVNGTTIQIAGMKVIGTADSISVQQVTLRRCVQGNWNDNTGVWVEYVVNVGEYMEKN